MHEPLLAQAALPARTVLQRTLLQPYSLSHELFLTREGNAFISGGTPTRIDLIQGVWICANTWEENKASANEFFAPLKAWIIARRFKSCDLKASLRAFREYLAAGSLEFPLSDIPRMDRKSAGRYPGAPFILRLHAFVMERLRKSESEAWDYPVGLAKMRWAAHWEQEEGLDIYGPHDDSFRKHMESPEANAALEELRRKAKKCRA